MILRWVALWHEGVADEFKVELDRFQFRIPSGCAAGKYLGKYCSIYFSR
jgi:hypothetical protein